MIALTKHLTDDDIRGMEDVFYRSRCGDVSNDSNRDVDLQLKAFIYERGRQDAEAED